MFGLAPCPLVIYNLNTAAFEPHPLQFNTQLLNLPNLSARRHHCLTSISWDDWVPEDRLRKLTQENRELANSLRHEMLAAQRAARAPPPAATKKKTQASTRGSEERQTSVAATGPRGQKRLRDHDLEKVSSFNPHRPTLLDCYCSNSYSIRGTISAQSTAIDHVAGGDFPGPPRR